VDFNVQINYRSDILHSSDSGEKMGGSLYQFIDFNTVYDSVGTEVLYNNFTEFDTPIEILG